MTSWILYWRVGLRRRRSRVSRIGRCSILIVISGQLGGSAFGWRSAFLGRCGGVHRLAGRIRNNSRRFGGIDMGWPVEALDRDFGGLRQGGDRGGLRLHDGGFRDGCFRGRRWHGGGFDSPGIRHRLLGWCDGDRLGGELLGRRFRSRRFGPQLGIYNGFSRRVAAVVRIVDVMPVDCGVVMTVVVFLGLGVQPLLLGDQPFAVGDRDLIVVGMNFREGEEAVAVAAVLHERRLQRRFDRYCPSGAYGLPFQNRILRVVFHRRRRPGFLPGDSHR